MSKPAADSENLKHCHIDWQKRPWGIAKAGGMSTAERFTAIQARGASPRFDGHIEPSSRVSGKRDRAVSADSKIIYVSELSLCNFLIGRQVVHQTLKVQFCPR